jgi:hypothetical protein
MRKLILVVTLLCSVSLIAASKKVKVYILAGQSNMEGKAKVELLKHQIKTPPTDKRFAHFHKNGEFIERDDVNIKFLNRKGKLTVGYGSPGKIGVELEFGHVMGNHYEEPVLLIKTAWGGKSIGRDFRPPSSGLPEQSKLDEILAKTNENNKKKKRKEITMAELKTQYGHYYRLMMSDVKSTLADLGGQFSEYKGAEYEICGFVWFQGYNDMFDDSFRTNYGKHMANFIRDVRKELNTPKLPVVIGLLGQNGFKEAKGGMADVKKHQWEVQFLPEFKGNVKSIKTDVFWDKVADTAYPTWRKNLEQWNLVGSDRPYHYLGSTLTFSDIGKAMAETMLELHK